MTLVLGDNDTSGLLTDPSLNISAPTLTSEEDAELDEEDYIFFRNEVKTPLIIAYTFVFVCCFVGNFLVIMVVLLHRRMRSMTNFFLANLAFANLCVGVFCIYQNLSQYLIASWVWGEFLCKMYHFIETLSYTASIAILTLLAVERYLAIIHPIRSKQIMTMGRLKFIIAMVWFVCAAYSSPRLLMYGIATYDSKNGGSSDTICLLQRALYDTKIYDSVTFVVCFLLPLFIITVMYVRIAIELWRGFSHVTERRHTPTPVAHEMVTLRDNACQNSHKNDSTTLTCCVDGNGIPDDISNNKTSKTQVTLVVNMVRKDSPAGSSSSQSSNHLQTALPLNRNNSWMSESESTIGDGLVNPPTQRFQLNESVIRGRRKVIRMLIAVVLSFAACNLPFHARKLWQYWSPSYDALSNTASLLTPITFLIMYLNTAINPILYAFLSRNFRKSMKDVMVCKFYRTRHTRNMSSTRSMKTQVTSCPTDC